MTTANLEEAVRLQHAATSARTRAMAKLEAWVDGTQYDGLPSWFDDEAAPLWERAPCIVYPIVNESIEANADLVMGEGRFPAISATNAGLEGEAAEKLDAGLTAAAHNARLHAAAVEVFEDAQGTRSGCAIFGVRSGRLFVDTVKAQWCTPTLELDGSCSALEIQYAYVEEIVVKGERKAVCKIYRRVIDDKADVTFIPAIFDGSADVTAIKWVADPKQSLLHNMGFCPVVWYPHMRGCSTVGRFDGYAVHENILDEVRGLDFALSQRHRAALYAGDPQWTETGVEPGYNPSAQVRKPVVVAQSSPQGGTPGAANPRHKGGYIDTSSVVRKARKKSPGTVWQYENENTKVTLHTLPGDALKSLDDNARDLRAKLCESLGVVFIDSETAEKVTGLSGRALEALRKRHLARCDRYRQDFGDRFLIPAIAMLLRIAMLAKLDIPKVAEAAAVWSPAWSWHCPPIDLVWGPYRELEPEEALAQVQVAAQALTAGIATKRQAVVMCQSVLCVTDVDEYMDQLEEEAEANQARAIELAVASKGPPNGAPDEEDDAKETEE